MTERMTFKCGHCGGKDFVYANNPPLPNDLIFCVGCDRKIGTIEEVKLATAKASIADLQTLKSKIF